MVTGTWWESTATFKKGVAEKASFILLNELDLALTVIAVYLGLGEVNPVMSFLLGVPALLLVVKLAIPILIAWVIPGRLLIPAIILLAGMAVWNIKELIVFLV